MARKPFGASLGERSRRTRGRFAGLRPAIRVPRFLAGLIAAALVAVSVALAVLGVPQPISGIGDLGANLGRNLVTGLALGLIAYLWYYSWTSDRLTHDLRESARNTPERLFPIPPRIGSSELVVGRQQLIEEVVTSLTAEFRTGPQVIVGETGSGTTSFLLGLATHLARERDVVPIVLSLRDLEELDFTQLAKERFAEYIDPRIRTEADAERLWRWMCRRGRIVVLADDLERAKLNAEGEGPDPYKSGARAALATARRRDLPLVVATRPEGVPANLEEPPIELGPLDLTLDEACDYVLERAGRSRQGTHEADLVTHNIDAGRLIDSAFYLGLLAVLLRARSLHKPPAGGAHAVRVALLEAWRASLLGDRTVTIEEKERRERALEDIERFAGERLSPEREAEERTDWFATLNAGERFGLLHTDYEGRHRFTHDVVHAYFASRAMTRGRDAWKDALERTPDAPRVQLALVLAAAAMRDPRFCHDVCAALLAESENISDERALLRAAAAAEVARAGAFNELDDRIASECMRSRRGASSVAKRAAAEQLALLCGERSVKALWDYAGDYDYQVRWLAIEKLVQRCSKPARVAPPPGRGVFYTGAGAYRILADEIESGLAGAAPYLDRPVDERPDDWVPEIAVLKHMAWMLPALKTAAASHDAKFGAVVSGHLDRLLRLEEGRVTSQRGLEASLAQGFKADAMLNRGAKVDRRALELLKRARFWYSQLNLLHAIALRVDDRDSTDALHAIKQLARGDRHPYVRAAATLCLHAIACDPSAGVDEIERYVWDDEGTLVSRRPAGLAPEAIQLAGDITVLLNLNETGDVKQREDFGERDYMPYCMSESRSRLGVFEGCPEGCDFNLCPFRPLTDRLSAHREISRAFCRHQRLHANARTARRWGSRVRQRELRDFWVRLEAQARI